MCSLIISELSYCPIMNWNMEFGKSFIQIDSLVDFSIGINYLRSSDPHHHSAVFWEVLGAEFLFCCADSFLAISSIFCICWFRTSEMHWYSLRLPNFAIWHLSKLVENLSLMRNVSFLVVLLYLTNIICLVIGNASPVDPKLESFRFLSFNN